MSELILDCGDADFDDGALRGGFSRLGWTVVYQAGDVGALVGRFDGMVGTRLSRRGLPQFLTIVDRCRPEWFALDQCDDVALDGYEVQRLNGRSLQFGHRSGWVIELDLVATPESVAMAIAQRRPAETRDSASVDPAAGDRRRRKLVTIPGEQANGFAGGKGGAGVWQAIVNQMPPHDVYVEGCLGRGAVMRHKRPADKLSIGVESDGDVIRAHWTGFDGVPGLRVIEADVRGWLRGSFGVGQVPNAACCLFCGARRLIAAATRNAAAQCSRPCPQCGSRVVVYIDPPYLAETRKSNGRMYRHEWSRADHVELLQLLTSLPCDVLVSGYDSDLYRSFLTNWRVVTFPAMTRGGSLANEHLWCNFAEPSRLHDPRWLGRDRRARERWRRRADSMSRKLLALSERERQAVLERVQRGGGLVDV